MSTVIIAHGPSLYNAGLGTKIDRFDLVIRLRRTQHQDVENYGTKTDYIVTQAGQITEAWIDIQDGKIPSKEVWIFPNADIDMSEDEEAKHPRLQDFKNSGIKYRICREYFWWATSKYNKNPKHGRLSLGLRTIIVSYKYLGIQDFVLGGFDNLFTGDDTNYISRHRRVLPPMRGGVSCANDKRLLEQMTKSYKLKIKDLVA